MIFYLAILESNSSSSILLEEPETHSYPPFTKLLAEKIVENKENQFFITTHSPYLLYNIIENTELDNLRLSIIYFEDFQTKIKSVSDEEISKILDESIDVFFNLDKWITHEYS